MCVPWDATPYELTYFMERFWNMRSPKIVLSIMSGVRNEKIWKNPRLRDQFKKGLIKVLVQKEYFQLLPSLNNFKAGLVTTQLPLSFCPSKTHLKDFYQSWLGFYGRKG